MARNAKTTDQPAPETAETPRRRDAETPQAATEATDATTRTPRPESKLATVVNLLERDTGATIVEIMVATGWQSHTVRGALSGMITKKLGHSVSSDKVEGRGRVYRIVPKAA